MRPHYAHTALFTHVKVTEEEMQKVATELALSMNELSGPAAVIVPMGGFSHHDCPGGAIEDETLREVCLATLKSKLAPRIALKTLDQHLFAPKITDTILTTLDDMTA